MPTFRFDLMFKAIRNHALAGERRTLNGAQGCGRAPWIAAPTKDAAVAELYRRTAEWTRPDADLTAVMVDGCYVCSAATARECACGRPKFAVDCELIPSAASGYPPVRGIVTVVAWDAICAKHTALDVVGGWSWCDVGATKVVHSVTEIAADAAIATSGDPTEGR